MKTTHRALLSLILTTISCGSPGPSPGPDAETSPESTALWPETPPVQGQGSTIGAENNPWLGGFGSTSSRASGGDLGLEPADGSGGRPTKAPPEEPPSKPSSSGGSATETPEAPGAASPELLLIRYEESTGSEKRVEIENVGRAIDANECSMSIFSNGNEKPYRTLVLGPLQKAERIRLCTTQVTDASCTLSLGSSSFNGNDALVIFCAGEIIDSLGRVGEDPGRGWSDGGVRTWDATLVRCEDRPDTDPSDPVVLGNSWALGPFDADAAVLDEICPKALGMGGAPVP